MSRVYNDIVKYYRAQMGQINDKLCSQYNASEQIGSVTESERAKKEAETKAQWEASKVYKMFAESRAEGLRKTAKFAYDVGEAGTDRLFSELDKTGQMKDPAELRAAYDRAEKFGDTTKQQAIATRALELGLSDVVNRYGEQSPDFADKARIFVEYNRAANAKGGALRDGMAIGSVRKPYAASRRQVEAGSDHRGATIYRTETVWSTTPNWPTDNGDEASHEAMGKAFDKMVRAQQGGRLHA